MHPSLTLLTVALSAVPCLTAQTPNKQPTFHLPAGDYTIVELLQQAEQAVRQKLHTNTEELGAALHQSVHLQSNLKLDANAWEDGG